MNWPLGARGVIVNKYTGDRLRLGSGMLPIGHDLAVYDKGYQFYYYDLVSEFQNGGFEIVYGPVVEPWGVRRFFVRDPFGRLVNILVQVDLSERPRPATSGAT